MGPGLSPAGDDAMTRTIMLRLAMLATAVLLVVALHELQRRTQPSARVRTTTTSDSSRRVVQRHAAEAPAASTRTTRASTIGALPPGMVPVSRVDPPPRDPSLQLPPPPVAPPNPAEHRPPTIAWPEPR